MRHKRRGHWIVSLIAIVLLLVIGTLIGQALPLGPLSLHVGFAPATLNLYVLRLSVSLATNVLGLIGAVVGLLLFRAA